MNKQDPDNRRFALTLAPLALAAALSACSPNPAPLPTVPSVFVSPVLNDTGLVQRVLFGSVHPRVEAELAFRTAGKVTERLVELGAHVRAGAVLARIDPADYQLAVQAATEQQRAAKVEAVQTASDAARFKRLLADRSVGAADAERQQARADAAVARLTQARTELELARNRAGYSALIAPFDGVVTSVHFEIGQMVDDKQAVLSLAQTDELEVQVDVPESLITGLNTWHASARPGATTDERVPLRLRELGPSATAVTRTFRARYALATPAHNTELRMGMTAEVYLTQSGHTPGVELPLGALLTTAVGDRAQGSAVAGASVWVVDAETGMLTRQPVQLLSQSRDHVRVAGLADGALVVTVGAHKLDAGLQVQAVQRPLAALAPAAAR